MIDWIYNEIGICYENIHYYEYRANPCLFSGSYYWYGRLNCLLDMLDWMEE